MRRPERVHYSWLVRVLQACGIHIYRRQILQRRESRPSPCRSNGVGTCWHQPSCKRSTAYPRCASCPSITFPSPESNELFELKFKLLILECLRKFKENYKKEQWSDL